MLHWYEGLDPIKQHATYFNFLASHDGIGLRPLEGLLSGDDMQTLVDTVIRKGGKVSWRNLPDGSQKPYELNISFLSMICDPADDTAVKARKFMASQAILLSVVGMPGIYIHSLLGSENDVKGMETSGINRRINREKLDRTQLFAQLNDANSLRCRVLRQYTKLLQARRSSRRFHPKLPKPLSIWIRACFPSPGITKTPGQPFGSESTYRARRSPSARKAWISLQAGSIAKRQRLAHMKRYGWHKQGLKDENP